MKTILLSSIILLAIFCIVGEIKITFNPFSISMPCWYRSVGWFLIWFGAILLVVGEQNNAYKRGYEQGYKTTIKILEEKTEEIIKEKTK